ncbi:hypothetical protein E7W39_00565 [Cronobacter sakazakii]|nr:MULTISPECIES: hypothetical protein [Cronobacter]EAU0361843.1 hypothetical protein [Salmonella enterica]EBM7745721.1 hypothetical protein [Salmonella enterica subsp. enterica serovar Kentucky]HAV1607747.1 hypothetical protein [Enterobacter hormaechei subsp. steigerwaltii]AXW99302.2 hypothetical protein CsakCS931_35455 [Cronobacter sakazakii]EAZ2237867.1 hypothetical protein [Salmonella enterica]
MAYPTNVVALVESDFLAKARDMMKDREKAFSLYEWSLKCLHAGEHRELLEQLLGELINEVFALNVQLHGRDNNQTV